MAEREQNLIGTIEHRPNDFTESEVIQIKAQRGRIAKLEAEVERLSKLVFDRLAVPELKFKASDGVKVDVIRDEDDMASDDVNALATQQSVKAYADTKIPTADLLDEDDMASDSATKPASQQSIKAYVDDNAGGGGNCYVYTGNYTGDGTNNRTITLSDSDLIIKHLWIFREPVDGGSVIQFFTNDLIMAEDTEGLIVRQLNSGTTIAYDNMIDNFSTGSFRVDSSVNGSGLDYFYTVWGTH